VSVRLTVSNLETLVANAMRRALVHGETDVVPRVSDLEALASSTAGKVEIESIDEGRDGQVVEQLLKSAVLTTFRDTVSVEELRDVVDAFEGSRIVHAGEDVSSADYVGLIDEMKALREPVLQLTGGDESAASIASAVEFLLEGLHLSKRLNKESVGARAQYRGRG
jgi:magnesium chelatase subunit I